MFDHSLRESLMLLIWLNLFKDDRVIALMGLLFVIVVLVLVVVLNVSAAVMVGVKDGILRVVVE